MWVLFPATIGVMTALRPTPPLANLAARFHYSWSCEVFTRDPGDGTQRGGNFASHSYRLWQGPVWRLVWRQKTSLVSGTRCGSEAGTKTRSHHICRPGVTSHFFPYINPNGGGQIGLKKSSCRFSPDTCFASLTC